MNSFDRCRAIEAKSFAILEPFLEEHSKGRYVITAKGPLSRALQLQCGDVLFNDARGDIRAVEIKAEEEEKWGNFFFETWSNRNLEDRASHSLRGSNQGWLYHTTADTLFYHFLDTGRLYIIDLWTLKRWAFGCGDSDGNIYRFPEKRQSKHQQRNDTLGRCVPITLIRVQVGFKIFYPLQADLFLSEAAA